MTADQNSKQNKDKLKIHKLVKSWIYVGKRET